MLLSVLLRFEEEGGLVPSLLSSTPHYNWLSLLKTRAVYGLKPNDGGEGQEDQVDLILHERRAWDWGWSSYVGGLGEKKG